MSAFERRWFVFFYARGGRGLDLFGVYAIDTQVCLYTDSWAVPILTVISPPSVVFSLQVWNENFAYKHIHM